MIAWTGQEHQDTTCAICMITVDAHCFDRETGLCDICFERDNRGKFRPVNPPRPVVMLPPRRRFAWLRSWKPQ